MRCASIANPCLNDTDVISIKGITNDSISSLGTTNINLFLNNMTLRQEFHVVPDSFNIPVDGILGKDFLKSHNCIIDYNQMTLLVAGQILIPILDGVDQNIYIPPRCEVIRKFRIKHNGDCVVDNAEVTEGVFISRTIVDPKRAYIRVLNTTDEIQKISNRISKVESLKDFDIYQIDTLIENDERNKKLLDILSQNSEMKNDANLTKLCAEFSDIFALKTDTMSKNNFYTQSLRLNDNQPVYIKNYRNPHSTKTEINKQVQNLLDNDLIEPASSNYNSPIILVPKKGKLEKKWRLCIDYRRLNKKLISDKFPLPRTDEILENLGKAKYFSVLDLYSGFHQIPLEKGSRDPTAFSTETGSYRWKVLPFGLSVAPNSFSRMMHLAFSGLPASQCFIYIDDIIVVGSSITHHLKNLRAVFEICRKYNLKLNPEKCSFFKTEVTFLGHVCSEEGIKPDSSKFDSIKNYPTPHDGDATRRFVALANYYRKFIPNFATISKPLNNLTKKNVKFEWTAECEKAFRTIKRILIHPNTLAYPDFSSEFTLTVDASMTGCGGVLQQNNKPIAFASKCFNSAEQKKATIEQELIAIHWAIKHFRSYLWGYHFTVQSDHKPLIYLFNLKDPTSKLTRLRLELAEYDFTVEHIPGKTNVVADALSRIHVKDLMTPKLETEKFIGLTTRSMTRKRDQENEQERLVPKNDFKNMVYEATNMHVNKKVPLLVTTMVNDNVNVNMKEFLTEMRMNNKSVGKFTGNLPSNAETFAEKFFVWIDQLSAGKALNNIKIYKNDKIFEMMSINAFKKLGNEILKNTSVAILNQPKIINDKQERQNLIRLNHDNPIFGGHLGSRRLYAKLRQNYSWKNMARDVATYVKNCHECQVNKIKKHTKIPMNISKSPVQPFDEISIDTIGPLPETETQDNYVVSILCCLSKYIILVPVRNKEAKTVARAIVEKVFLVYGICKRFRTDMGTEYVNKLFKDIVKILEIEHSVSTPYHHESIGDVERSHRSLNEYLRIYLNDNLNDWDKFAPYFAYSYNVAPHTSFDLKFTPFELVFSRTPLTPESLESDIISPIYNMEDYSKEMKFRFQVSCQIARQLLKSSKERNKKNYDKKLNEKSFKINDKVLALSNAHKLGNRYDGPFTVIEVSEHNVKIKDDVSNKIKTMHKNRIVKYFKQ